MRCIDADALIKKANYEADGMMEPFKSQFGVLVEWLINKMPNIDPEPQWIPVSERFPDKAGAYLITKYDDEVTPYYCYDGDRYTREYWKSYIKAWMPMPEPYKERREE